MSYGVNAPIGIVPVGTTTGAPITNNAQQTFNITSGYATNLFTNDPIAPLNNGTIGIGVVGTNTPSVGTLGTFNGCVYTDTTGTLQKKMYWPASTAIQTNTVALGNVFTDPSTIFDVQVNGNTGSGTASLTNNFNTFNFSLAIAGNTSTGLSGATLDLTAIPSQASWANFKVIGLTTAPGNAWGIQYNNVQVIFSNHFFRAGQAGI